VRHLHLTAKGHSVVAKSDRIVNGWEKAFRKRLRAENTSKFLAYLDLALDFFGSRHIEP